MAWDEVTIFCRMVDYRHEKKKRYKQVKEDIQLAVLEMLLYPTDLIGEVNVLSDVEEFRKPLFEEMSGWV